MRFDQPSQDDQPVRPKSIIPQSDRSIGGVRTRIFMLFVMLIIVIIMMQEAGKPERWEWMGFKQGDEQGDVKAGELELRMGGGKTETPVPSENGKTPEGSAKQNQASSESGQASSAAPITIDATEVFFKTPDESELPPGAVKFWAENFRKLGDERERQFMRLLKHMRLSRDVPEETRDELRSLVSRLDRLRREYHQELFDLISVSPEKSPDKERMTTELYESKEIWEKKIEPALKAAVNGEDFTISQQQAIVKLQKTLDHFLYQQVQDKTSLGWTGDTSAWLRTWEFAIHNENLDAPRVNRIELIGQPDSYRGKPVQIEGWVRSARKEVLRPDSEVELPHYFALWIRPRESKLGPFNVYVKELPADFPAVTEKFSDMNISVKLNGYFFKNRTYVAADRSVENSPVIIASTLEVVPEVEFTAVDNWQPSRAFLICAFLLIPLVATGCAWMAFHASKTKPFTPGAKSQARIDNVLGELSNDPDILTEREKITALYEADLETEND